MSGVDIAHLQKWQGHSETVSDVITPQLLRGFRAVLDLDPGLPVADEVVPQALHWFLSPPTVAMHELGPDGHPARGGFLPPVPLPRRMWAGGRLIFHDELRVGDTVERVSTVQKVTLKEGRSGQLCLTFSAAPKLLEARLERVILDDCPGSIKKGMWRASLTP